MATATDTSADVEEILAVHKAWMDSNNGLVIEDMVPQFADPGYLQYNLNGHTYNGVQEKVKLWEGFHLVGQNLADCGDIEEPQVYVEGDLAYLTVLGSAKLLGRGNSGTMEFGSEVTFRVTEVYRRNDGKGAPVWKIWHFHCSLVDTVSPKYPQDA